MKILIIEDETELLSAIVTYLKSEGFLCETSGTYQEAEEKILMNTYDCIIADIGLPDGNGLNLVNGLKSKVNNTGIIIISARSTVDDRINGLDTGADDYLIKPFHLPELNARLKAILRRRKFDGNNEISFREIKIKNGAAVEVNDKPLTLTKKELDILLYFIINTGKVISKEIIIEHLWGDYVSNADSYDFIYTHISNLRKKLIDKGAQDYIRTVHGIGYQFSAQ